MFKQSDKLKLPGHIALLRRRLCACMVSVRPLMFFFFLCDIWWLFARAANGKAISYLLLDGSRQIWIYTTQNLISIKLSFSIQHSAKYPVFDLNLMTIPN